jgi:sigma-B regulation protein RsbU (phosphoserine phosphatase)
MTMPPHEKAPLSATLTEHGITVLLVDDQAIVAAAVKRMLETETDISFHYCQDPNQALQKAFEVSPTVILQDLVMPDIDGLTLVKFFRAHPRLKNVPLIVLSTREEAATKAEAFALGANDYLVKLPDRIELIARIRYHSAGYINLLQRNEAYEALLSSQQALASELSMAADYVISLLPQPITAGSIQTRWRYFPSTQLGGDCFGYHWIDENHFAMYLLDVCGHGVGAALLSVSALNVLRAQSLRNTDFHIPDRVLASLNDAFQMQDHNDLYFTIWYGVYNHATREIRYASGGHPPAILITGAGETSQLITQNFFIGGMPDSTYESGAVSLPAGSARLYIFSDGAYEVDKPGGGMWTLEELQAYLLPDPPDEAQEIEGLYHFLQGMCGQATLDDDFSMLKISFEG